MASSLSPAAAAAKPPPDLDIPSGATVSVKIIDTTSLCKLPLNLLMGPHVPGHDFLSVPAYSFLIEHPSGRSLLYDLGTRKNVETLPANTIKMLDAPGWYFGAEKHCAEILEEHGVAPGSIEAVVWSHWHFDHTGDMKTFPPHVKLIVGAGFQKGLLPGYPTNPESHVLEADWEGRELVELDYSAGLQVSRYKAIDYFHDGSFYLLDAPGHAVGHTCGLARVTHGTNGAKDTFILMGGDTCHHGGIWKPNEYLPLPKEVPLRKPIAGALVCPGSLFQAVHFQKSATTEFYTFAPGFQHEHDVAIESKNNLQAFDAAENVLVIIAHDPAPLEPDSGFTFFPHGTINDWKAKKLDEKIRWRFLEDFAAAVEAGAEQEKVLTKGVEYK